MNITIPNPPYPKCGFNGCKATLLPYITPYMRMSVDGLYAIPNTASLKWECSGVAQHEFICQHDNCKTETDGCLWFKSERLICQACKKVIKDWANV